MRPFALHLMRHGATADGGRFNGRTDVAPTAAGIDACIDQASDLNFDLVVSSDLQRCTVAAQRIARAHRVELRIDRAWRELDFGHWDGLDPRDLDPQALSRFWTDPDKHPPEEGERWSDLVRRVSDALSDMERRSTLVVAHGGSIRAALAHLCGFDMRQVWAFRLGNAALISLEIWPGDGGAAQIVGLRA
ncbi:MAG: histidine phosphatase family protein [Rhizorhabdus sp.]|uniref:histidine phosphatase family protein n=1 Tax=Rhizorhabdus sp. TaxID=1968843 RepID=UPI001B4BD671|nr:histidine phosphatase family protein [Rhizorhabdus sp.]MBP8231895.1 histidine phosphatase family protein [Rhizorhabdus sp.]